MKTRPLSFGEKGFVSSWLHPNPTNNGDTDRFPAGPGDENVRVSTINPSNLAPNRRARGCLSIPTPSKVARYGAAVSVLIHCY
jgi:hypothetical protein